MTPDPLDPRDPFDAARRDLERGRHLGDELLRDLVVIAVLLLTLAVILSLGDR